MNGNTMAKGRTKLYTKGDIALKEDKPLLTTGELIEAMFDVESVLQGCMCPFVLLEETARQIREESKKLEPHLELDEITVGVRESYLAESVRAMLRTMKPQAEWSHANITYTYKRVPIVIWRIHKELEVFHRPDKIFFYTTELYVPNPFRAYWNMRDLVE